MNTVLLRCAAILLTLAAWSAFGHEHDNAMPSPGEKLGSVHFRTSCTPEAQKQFEHALNLLHSFYFPKTVEAFKGVAQMESDLRDCLLGHCDELRAPIPWSAPSTQGS
jgi:hypothetical protein